MAGVGRCRHRALGGLQRSWAGVGLWLHWLLCCTRLWTLVDQFARWGMLVAWLEVMAIRCAASVGIAARPIVGMFVAEVCCPGRCADA